MSTTQRPKKSAPKVTTRKNGTVKKNRTTNTKRNSRKTRSSSKRFVLWKIALWAIAIILFLSVAFYFIFIDSHSFRWRAVYGEAKYPAGYEIHGIDISRYQETIDWELVRNAQLDTFPVQFVFIKATEGEELVDSYFKQNFTKAKENNLIRGAYHFFIPGVDPEKQAQSFISQVQLQAGDLPPVLDVEKDGRLSKKELREAVKKWLDIIEKEYRVKPIIYTGHKFKMKYLNTPIFNNYPNWIAHYYIDSLEFNGNWSFWQHTDYGKVNGINGPVDCNVFNGSIEELMALTIPDTTATSDIQ